MKLEVMKFEVRNHEVRISNELPGIPYCCCCCVVVVLRPW